MTYETILYDTDGAIATITLNRPRRLNSIVPQMVDDLDAAVREANRDAAVKVVVLRGAGRAFCAGFDFGQDFSSGYGTALYTDGRWDPGKDMIGTTSGLTAPVPRFMSVWRSPKPVIAQVHGWCVGGGSDLALCADLVIASEDAQIGTPYARMWGCYITGMWIYRPARRTNGLALTCWVPVACLVAIEIYVRNFDGWGAWATAPLFLLPLLLSLAIAGAGAVQCFSEIRAGSLRPSTAVFTGVAALPLVWLLVRRHLV